MVDAGHAGRSPIKLGNLLFQPLDDELREGPQVQIEGDVDDLVCSTCPSLSGAHHKCIAGDLGQEFAGEATKRRDLQRAARVSAHCEEIWLEHGDLVADRGLRVTFDQLESWRRRARRKSRQEVLGFPLHQLPHALVLASGEPCCGIACAKSH